MTSTGSWSRGADPTRILSRRPRLSFSAAEIDTVADGLDRQRNALIGGASDLIDDLDRELVEGS